MTRACRFLSSVVLLWTVGLATPAATLAQGSLNVYCSVQGEGYKSPNLDKLHIKLINDDFAKYGASAERKRLLERWEKEVRP